MSGAEDRRRPQQPLRLPGWLPEFHVASIETFTELFLAARGQHPKWKTERIWRTVRGQMVTLGLVEDEEERTKTVDRPRRGPGRTGKTRPLRVALWIEQQAAAKRVLNPRWTQQKAEVEARRDLKAHQRRFGKTGDDLFAEWQPTSRAPQDVDPQVLFAAAMSLPVMRWLRELMLSAVGGTPVDRRTGFWALAWMAGLRNLPILEDAADAVLHPSERLAWATDYCVAHRRPQPRQVERYVHVLCAWTNPFVLQHVLVELHRQLHDRDTPSVRPRLTRDGDPVLRPVPDTEGRPLMDEQGLPVLAPALEVIPVHEKGGQVAITDGTFVECELPQVFTADEKKLRRMIYGGHLGARAPKMAGPRVHRDAKGRVEKRMNGVAFQPVIDGADGEAWATTIRSGGKPHEEGSDSYEPRVGLELVQQIKFLYPEWGGRYMVADALHDHSKEIAAAYFREHRMLPVFHRHGVTGDSPTSRSGRPRCLCGLPATPRTTRPDRMFDDRAAIEWRCGDFHDEDVCKWRHTSFVREDPHLHTPLLRFGTYKSAALRAVLLASREMVESYFASLQWRGILGRDFARPRWAAKDPEIEWLLGLAAVIKLAERVAYEDGTYHRKMAEARAWGVLESRTERSKPGPDEEGVELMRAARVEWEGPPRPPRSWDRVDDRGRDIPNLPFGAPFLGADKEYPPPRVGRPRSEPAEAG